MTLGPVLLYNFHRHPSAPERDEHGEVRAATDWLGNRFQVGEPVLYCVAAGSSGADMAMGLVVRIQSEAKTRNDYRIVEGETRWDPVEIGYDEVRVMVRTLRTSAVSDYGERDRSCWINARNITALPLGGWP